METLKSFCVKTDLLPQKGEPAPLIDLGQKREEFRRKRSIQQEALEVIGRFREVIRVYETEMRKLAANLTPEQLALVAPLTPEEQIRIDLARLDTFAEALETIVKEKKGLSLPDAFHILKVGYEGEMAEVIDYIEKSTYPIFIEMRNLLDRKAYYNSIK